jgi:hypothetical protein
MSISNARAAGRAAVEAKARARGADLALTIYSIQGLTRSPTLL